MPRLLGFVNLLLALIALLLVLGFAKAMTDPEAPAEARVYSVALAIYFLLFAASGAGLVMRQRWAERLTVAPAALLIVEGGFHAVQGQWGSVVFCVAYAGLVGWVLLHPGKKEEAGSGGTDPA